MKKVMFALSTTFILVVGLGMMPTAAFAQGPMGTVETNAVTGPIEVGGITYVPCAATCGRSSISAMEETLSILSSAEVEDVAYEDVAQ